MLCVQSSVDLLTLIFDLLSLTLSDELRFIHPTYTPVFYVRGMHPVIIRLLVMGDSI